MKTILVTLALVITAMSSAYADHHEKSGPYRHVVCFKFKDDATKEQVASIEKAFTELSRKVDTVTGYDWGTNVSPENHAQGFTHCFIVTFKDKKGLDVYLEILAEIDTDATAEDLAAMDDFDLSKAEQNQMNALVQYAGATCAETAAPEDGTEGGTGEESEPAEGQDDSSEQ